ncbi:MAG: cell wall hydrolase [Lachnospiraceae bacterium]|nr:cell wall hydrolase [Lachnospiraceae bacterium]
MSKRSAICTAAGFLAFILLFGQCVQYAAATEKTRKELEEAKQQHEQSVYELSEQEDSINQLNAEKDSLLGQLSDLNTQLTEVSESLEEIEAQIHDKEGAISVAAAQLSEAEKVRDEQYAAMKKRVQFIYEKQNFLMTDMLFGSSSFADFLNQSHYVARLSAYDRRMLEIFAANGEKITEKKEQLEHDRALLDEYQNKQEAEQSRVSGLLDSTAGRIASYEGQIDMAESVADQIAERLKRQEDDIKLLEARLEEEKRLSALAKKSTWRDISGISFAEGDRYLLASIIYCEAGAEPYDGKVAVGAVVINRVRSGVFPDTVVGVIYQAHQFTPVSTGRLALALAGSKATEDCYRAADEAMKGYTNVGNCVYFRTPVKGLSGISIGGHIFY